MDRKRFLSLIPALGAAASLSAGAPPASSSPDHSVADEKDIQVPPALQPGDLIGITSPAGHITLPELQPALQLLQQWGFSVRLGTCIGRRDYNMGGTDEERRTDLQQLLDDPSVKAILCARGGYGCIRIVDRLNWTRFRQKPKWVIGFSDVSVLHQHIHRNCRVATLHSKMCNSFPDNWSQADPVQVQTILSIRDALLGKKMQYSALPNAQNRLGKASGILIGGNLKLMETLAGSASDIHTAGKILFVEDTGEYLYSIDRMFWNLKRTGKLNGLKALIVGGFNIKPDDPGEEFGRSLQDIVLEKVKEFNYPVCFDFPVGHQRANFALKCGVRHQLEITPEKVNLTETI